MKIIIPHIHKIEGEAGFWAEITKTGKIEQLKFQTLLGLRQIEGILIGRRYFEVPIIVSRICGICPGPHILAASIALEKALKIEVSENTILLRKLLLVANIIHSHTLHLFFLSLPDFFDIENDLDLMKKFPKEAKAALKIRELALKIMRVVGGREIHPITPVIGGFSKIPEKGKLKDILKRIPFIIEETKILVETFKKIEYPILKRETLFASIFSRKEYPFYLELEKIIKIGKEKITISDFYSNEIKEDLKLPPVKKVKFRGLSYMLGAIARMKNSSRFLKPLAKENFKDFQKKQGINNNEFFQNTYFNLFFQALEVLHFLEVSQDLIKKILKRSFIKEEKKEIIPRPSNGLSAGLSVIEAPRGTLFHYYEIDKTGRIFNCNIITPTAQFLANLEEDLKILLPKILNFSKKEQKRKIRSLIRAYDPCISCATH